MQRQIKRKQNSFKTKLRSMSRIIVALTNKTEMATAILFTVDGRSDGNEDGVTDGTTDGCPEGDVGSTVGCAEGWAEGCVVG
jgi:hypothetical protein